jgi:hypothetical protein
MFGTRQCRVYTPHHLPSGVLLMIPEYIDPSNPELGVWLQGRKLGV